MMRVDEIKKIYENKVIPFENTDDSYKSKMSAYYSEWSSMGDKFSDAGNAIRDFLAGIGDSLVDTVKGLLTLVVDLGLLYVHSECSRMTLGHVPETLDQEVEKIKQKYEPLLKDPVNTIGGIGQSICDTADEKGVAYSSGYIVTEVVTALLADKGLDKLKNVAKTGKTADNVADIAEGAAKGAESAAEDAGKVVESGKYSKYLEQLDNLPENKVNHIIEGSPRLGHDHRWDCLVEGKEWSKIKEIICNVMEDGTEYPSGSASCKVMNIKGYDVEVRFKRLSDGTVRISDAFVR